MDACTRRLDLVKVRTCGRVWEVRRTIGTEAVAHVLCDPDKFLCDPSRQFKSSRVVTVSRVPSACSGQPTLVLRRLNYGKLRHRLRDLLRVSRARRAFRHGLRLEGCGIATPRVLAAADCRCWCWPVAAYLITEEIPGAKTLARFLAEEGHLPRLVVERLAELIALLHCHGFSHRDLKPTNLLLDADLRPWLIDLDGLSRPVRLSERRVVLDLVRLAVGVEGYAGVVRRSGFRFLRRYCERRGLGEAGSRHLAVILADRLRGG